jgi:hypothetical protein
MKANGDGRSKMVPLVNHAVKLMTSGFARRRSASDGGTMINKTINNLFMAGVG